MINAQAETIANKLGFRDAYEKPRRLIPASGFYEWAKMTVGTKQPVHVGMRYDKSCNAVAYRRVDIGRHAEMPPALRIGGACYPRRDRRRLPTR